MSKYEVYFSESAQEDLNAIAEMIFQVSKSGVTTMRFVSELRTSVSHLSEFPESGKCLYLLEYADYGIRYLIHKEYLLFYTIDETSKKVLILGVIDGRREYIDILKNRL